MMPMTFPSSESSPGINGRSPGLTAARGSRNLIVVTIRDPPVTAKRYRILYMQSGDIAATSTRNSPRKRVRTIRTEGGDLSSFYTRAAITPAQQATLDGFRAEKEQENKGHDEKNKAHGQRGIVCALGKLKQIAKAAGRGDKLAHASAGESKSDGHFQTAKHPRRHGRNINFA